MNQPVDELGEYWRSRRVSRGVICFAAVFVLASSAVQGDAIKVEVDRAIAAYARPPEVQPPGNLYPQKIRRIARLVWPDGDMPAGRIDHFLDVFHRLASPDRSLVYLAAELQLRKGRKFINGASNVPTIGLGIKVAIEEMDTPPVAIQIEKLPSSTRLGGDRFGVCQVAAALTYAEPSSAGGVQTQLMYGEPVFLLDRRDGWLLVHAGDGYWGWVESGKVRVVAASAFVARLNDSQATLLRDVEHGGVTLPAGACLPVVQRAAEQVRLRGIESDFDVASGSVTVVPVAELEAGTARRVRGGLALLGTPYVFGGRSSDGLDCSGLMNNLAGRSQVPIARDAWQQALAGRLVGTGWYRGAMRAGDQVYFVDAMGKIYHTGIALSGTHILHAAPPAVQIGSIDPEDRLYDYRLDRDLFMIKRP